MSISRDTAENTATLAGAGLHFAFSKRRRHPTVAPYLSPLKSKNDTFDLAKTGEKLTLAAAYAKTLSKAGKMILFVGTKPEAKGPVGRAAEETDMPYVTNRWIGGTLTNFSEIQSRVGRLENLLEQKEKGELDVYTKKERLLLQKEAEDLSRNFSGLVSMKRLPDALFIVDAKSERAAVAEARKLGIPIISLSNSDCNFDEIDYPIPGNDASLSSIELVMRQISDAVKDGKRVGIES